MREYWSIFRIRFIHGLQYRSAAYAGMITQFFWGFMEILLFSAFYKTDASAFPMEFSQLTSYVWLQQAFLSLFAPWGLDWEIFDSIQNGMVAYELCRPLNLYNMWLTKNLALRAARAALRCMPILMVAVLLPAPYNLALPVSSLAFLQFLLSLILGTLVISEFCMLIYVVAFYTLSPAGIRAIAVSFMDFLSGGLIPLPFFPDGFRQVVELFPFASGPNTPFLIYGGHITGHAAWRNLIIQGVWVFLLLLLGKVSMKKALDKVVVQGG